MDVYLFVLDSTRLVLESFDILLVLCFLIIIGVIGAFLRKISSSSKHPCTGSPSKASKSNLKTSPQQGKRQGSVTFAEGTKFDELAHQDSVCVFTLHTQFSKDHSFYIWKLPHLVILIFNLYCKVELVQCVLETAKFGRNSVLCLIYRRAGGNWIKPRKLKWPK